VCSSDLSFGVICAGSLGLSLLGFYPEFYAGYFKVLLLSLGILVTSILFWAVLRSVTNDPPEETHRRGTKLVGTLIMAVVLIGFFNLQPFLIKQLDQGYQFENAAATTANAAQKRQTGEADISIRLSGDESFSLSYKGSFEKQKSDADKNNSNGLLNNFNDPFSWITGLIDYLSKYLTAIAAIVGSAVAFFGGGQATKTQETGVLAIIKGYSTSIALVLAGLALPFVLWYLYLHMSYWGILLNQSILNDQTVLPLDLPRLPNWFINQFSQYGSVGERIPMILLIVTAASLIFSLVLRRNSNSLHGLYKDRLSRAFLTHTGRDEGTTTHTEDSLYYRLRKAVKSTGDGTTNGVPSENKKPDPTARLQRKLSEISDLYPPFQLINAALNVQGSERVNKRGRNAEFFTFSKTHVGSHATQYVRTEALEQREPNVTLGTAMAVSAAAASTAMGSNTMKPLAFTLALLNVRLGYWLRNPAQMGDRFQNFIEKAKRGFKSTPLAYLLAEVLGWLKEDSSLIYLTDGGHIENLGLYSLLRRRCKFIIVIDGEADPELTFSSFVTAQRYARIDLGTRIYVRLDEVKKAYRNYKNRLATKNTDGSGDVGDAKGDEPHCALGTIHYPRDSKGKTQTGILLYVKSAITGDENDYIRDYAQRNNSFPHETTGDQFFSEDQFEVYRSLGFHSVFGALSGQKPVATKDKPVKLTRTSLRAVKDQALSQFLNLYGNIQKS